MCKKCTYFLMAYFLWRKDKPLTLSLTANHHYSICTYLLCNITQIITAFVILIYLFLSTTPQSSSKISLFILNVNKRKKLDTQNTQIILLYLQSYKSPNSQKILTMVNTASNDKNNLPFIISCRNSGHEEFRKEASPKRVSHTQNSCLVQFSWIFPWKWAW